MEKNLQLISQYIKDLSFENYAAQNGVFSKEKPKINIDIKIQRKKLQNGFSEITLLILLEAKTNIEKIFLIELSYAATFSLKGLNNLSDEKYIFFVDCPNIIFPFARQILYNVTQNSGFPPLTLDYINFSNLFKKHKKI